MDDLITNALGQTTDTLLQRSQKKSRRALDHADLSGLFGIDMTDTAAAEPRDEEPAPPAGNSKKPANKPAKKPVEKPAAKKQTVKKSAVTEKTTGTGKKRGRPRKKAVEPAVEQ